MAWVDVLSSVSIVAMSDFVPIAFGRKANDGIVVHEFWLSFLFFTRTMAASVSDFIGGAVTK